jgi:hypothetical protein
MFYWIGTGRSRGENNNFGRKKDRFEKKYFTENG